MADLEQDPHGPTGLHTTVRDDVRAALDGRLADAQRTHRLPSVVAAVFGPGDRGGSGGAGLVPGAGMVDGGPPTADVQYRMGSITKTMVAVAVMRLRDEGLLDLDDRIAAHLRDGEVLADHPVGRATIAQTLQHAAGLGAETTGPWWERAPGGDLRALLDDVAGRPPAGPSDRRFHYSNVGFGLLGGVIEHHRGRSWTDVVTDEVLRPLGMHRTTPRPTGPAAPGLAVHPWSDAVLAEPEHDAGAMAPAGQLWTSLADLVRWGRFLGRPSPHQPVVDGHRDRGAEQVLAAATLEEMCVPGMVVDMPGQPWTIARGLGLQVSADGGTRRVGHGGSMPGFLAAITVDRTSGVGLALMTNTTHGLDPELGRDLLDLAGPHVLAHEQPWKPTPPAADVADLLGMWFWGPRPHVVRATPDGFRIETLDGAGRESRFVRDGEGWVGLDGYYAGERLRVVGDADGTSTWLDIASFILTRSPYDPAADVPGGVAEEGWG